MTDTAAIGMVRTEVSVPDPSAPVDASRWSWRPPLHLVVAALLALALGVLVSPGLSRGVPQYAVGDFTTRSVRAPFDFSVVDAAATERRRREAALTAPVIVAVDSAAAGRLASQLGGALAPLARLFEDADARRVPADAAVRGLSARRRAALEATLAKDADGWLAGALDRALPAFEASVGARLAPADRAALVRERFGGHLARALVFLAERVYTPPIVADRASLDVLLPRGTPAGARAARPIVLREASGAERAAAGDPPLQALDEAVVLVPARAEAVLPGVAADTRQALGRLLVSRLAANAAVDPTASAARESAAAQAVLPVSLSFRRNQLIVGEGQEVTPQVALALDDLRARQLPAAFGWLLAGSSVLFFLLACAGPVARPASPGDARAGGGTVLGAIGRDTVFLASGLVLATVFLRLWHFGAGLIVSGNSAVPAVGIALLFPLAGLPMLTRFVVDEAAALAQLLVWALVVGLLADHQAATAAAVIAIGLVGMRAVASCSSRACVLRAGLRVGPAAAAAALGLALVAQLGPGGSAITVLLGACGGAASGLVVIALAPAVEWWFGYTTRINLLEMISYEHPLLKRLIAEAPGTFQHSATVGVLADAGASAIGADRLLVRVGALYHDVGKIANGALFIENQSGPNPHDTLAPIESARIIRRHVADGVRLVEQYRLSGRVADFVREHHGTRPIVYFLERARAAGLPADEEEYSYPGPRPASRETTILMLADQVEALGRAKPGLDAVGYRSMIAAMIEQLRGEGQLDQAPVTTGELGRIRDAMAEVLVRMHHRRVPYPGQEGGPPIASAPANPAPSAS